MVLIFRPAIASTLYLLLQRCWGVHCVDWMAVVYSQQKQETNMRSRLSTLRERALSNVAAATRKSVTICIPFSPLLFRRIFVHLQDPSRIVEMAVSCLGRAGAAVILLPTPNASPRTGAAAAVEATSAPSALRKDSNRGQKRRVTAIPEGISDGKDQPGESGW